MSLLDTIKSLFFGDKPENTSVTEKVEDVVEEIKETVEEVVEDIKEKAEEVVEDIKETVEEVVEAVEEKIEEVTSAIVGSTPASSATGIKIPEDSTLKRHFISALIVEIEADMPARPTDSALKRHYDAAVQAKLDELIG